MASAATADRPNHERELVFCHVCSEEWYRDTHGLVCTRCGSDFCEIIENERDPLAGLFGLDDGNNEEHEERHHQLPRQISPGGTTVVSVQGPNFSFYSSRTMSPGVARNPREGLVRTESDMFVNLLSSLIQNIVGDQNISRSPGLGAQRDGHDQGPGQHSSGEAGGEEHGPEHRSPEGEQRPSIFGPRLTPRDANSPQATSGEPHVIDLPTFLLSLFPNVAPSGADAGDAPQLGPAFFSQFFPRGPTGDYVYSQRELDEIITRLMEQHQGNAPPPAPKEEIDRLPRVKVTEAQAVEGIDCAVCKDELNVGEEVCQLPCKHVYHFDCVKTWLEAHNTCPICRSPITGNTAENNHDHHQQQQDGTSSPSPTSPHPHPPPFWVSGAPQPQPGSPHSEHGNPTWSRSWSASWAFGGNNDTFRQTSNQRQDEHEDNNNNSGGGGNNQSSGRTFANLFRRGGSH